MNYLIFFLSASLLNAVFAKSICGSPDWIYSPISKKCYKLFKPPTDWSTAEFYCDYLDAHHVSIHSAFENQFVTELAKQVGTIWIGAIRFDNLNRIIFSDYTELDFENWEGGRRPSYHRRNKCAQLDASTGKWFQRCCGTDPAGFICQKNPVVIPEDIKENISKPDSTATKKNKITNERKKLIKQS